MKVILHSSHKNARYGRTRTSGIYNGKRYYEMNWNEEFVSKLTTKLKNLESL